MVQWVSGQRLKLHVSNKIKFRWLVGCWAAFEDILFPDRMCDSIVELGIGQSGSVTKPDLT